jgi:membrane associated rhomboid family serine protease
MTTPVRTGGASTALAAVKSQAATLGTGVALGWAAFVANAAVGGALLNFGIVPRTEQGLWGILFAPFLHGNLNHIISNTIPFVVLGWLVMLRSRRYFIPVTLCAMLFSGVAAWLLGTPGSVTIGASGVIFGYLGYLMLTGLFTRSLWSILISVGVTALWGGLVFGVLPGQPGISWQAHFGGFVGGLVAARLFRRR